MRADADALSCRVLSLPRDGNSPEEYEDAHAANAALGRYAVADGASESSFAGEWARLLAEAFVAAPLPRLDWERWLPPLRERWLAQATRGQLSWYAQDKLELGAFATFLGVEFTDRTPAGLRWRAVAVGDSCLFQLRGAELVASFPLHASGEFTTRPELIGSQPHGPPVAARERTAIGLLRPGDRLLLMTDALAQWFLAQQEAGGEPGEVLHVMDEEIFGLWASSQRAARALKNDDVTLVTLELPRRPDAPE